MKRIFWQFLLPAWLLAGPARAQSLAGVWQGVEDEFDKQRYCPSVLRVQQRAGTDLFGILFQQSGSQAGITVTFQMDGSPTPAGMRLQHGRRLAETGRSPTRYWCGNGTIAFTYDAAQEKLTGHAEYEPYDDCDTGEFTFYRVKLKSAATVPAGALSTLRVTGREVRWYADADLKQLVATGNTYPTRLRKATTFYLTQNFYPTAESPVVPITVRVSGPAPAVAARPRSAPVLLDTLPLLRARLPLPPVAALPAVAASPVVLPTVLFKVTTADLLPTARPALAALAAELRAHPELRLRIAGHTDRVGESTKNQQLSEQRAEAVKAYLVQAGVAAERLSTVGYGDARPLYPAPDARNRRVEVQPVP